MRLIDADALIEGLLEARHEETETTLKLVRFIRKQPTIEPSLVGTQMSLSKRGRWIRKSEETPYLQGVCKTRCSECGGEPLYISTDEWEETYRERLTPYCPNCGAKMEDE